MLQLYWVCTLLKTKHLRFPDFTGFYISTGHSGSQDKNEDSSLTFGEISHKSSQSFPLGRKQTRKLDKDCACPTKGSDETTGHLMIKRQVIVKLWKGFKSPLILLCTWKLLSHFLSGCCRWVTSSSKQNNYHFGQKFESMHEREEWYKYM